MGNFTIQAVNIADLGKKKKKKTGDCSANLNFSNSDYAASKGYPAPHLPNSAILDDNL